MKTIPLTKGYEAMVDDEDYDLVAGYKWYVSISYGIAYAKHMLPIINGKRKEERMHQLILGVKDTEYVDHIDGNGLNNQRSNLRVVTHRQNCMNRHPKVPGRKSSQYPGVTWNKRAQKWNAQAQVNGVHKHIGTYETEADAYDSYIAFVSRFPELPRKSRSNIRSQASTKEIENYVHGKKE